MKALLADDLETVKPVNPRIKIQGYEITVAVRLGDEEVVRFLARSPQYAVAQVVLQIL